MFKCTRKTPVVLEKETGLPGSQYRLKTPVEIKKRLLIATTEDSCICRTDRDRLRKKIRKCLLRKLLCSLAVF